MSATIVEESQNDVHMNSMTFLFDSKFVQKKSLVKKAKADNKKRIIEGFANFRVIDRIGDLIDPSAFQKSLATYKQNAQLRFNHEEGSSIGMVTDIEIRDNGLWIRGEIGKWALANDKWEQMQFGSLKALSVMGRVVDWIEKSDPSGRMYYYITEFELIEIAVVEIPMNQLSLFEVKSAKKLTKNRDAYLDVHQKLKAFLLKNYQKRFNNMTETKETEKAVDETVIDETVKTEKVIEKKSIDETVKTEKALIKKASKEEDEDEEDSTEDSLKSISNFVKSFADDITKRVEALEAGVKGAKMDEEEDEEDDKEKSLDLTLESIKNLFSSVMDEKMKGFVPESTPKTETVVETEPVVEEVSIKKSFRKTVSNHNLSVEAEVKGLAGAIKQRIANQ